MLEFRDNVIEWENGDSRVCVSFYQQKYINKVKALAAKYPDEVEIVKKNDDGSICAHLPLNFVKLSHPPIREMTEEERAIAIERLAKARDKMGKKGEDNGTV